MASFKIMTFNVLHIDDNPLNQWQIRKRLIRDLLDREVPDLLGTQECLYTQVQDMAEMLPDHNWVGLGRQGGSKDDYMAIFYRKSRFDLLEYDHFWLSDTPNVIGSMTFGNTLPRMVTWGKFLDKQTGIVFYHLNTHLDYICEEARVKGAKLIVEKVRELEEGKTIFLTADFNTDVLTEPYEIFTKTGCFQDTWNLADNHENEHLGTMNDFIDPTGGDRRIDWILAKGKVKVESIKIIGDCIDGNYPSDHFPVIADCSLN